MIHWVPCRNCWIPIDEKRSRKEGRHGLCSGCSAGNVSQKKTPSLKQVRALERRKNKQRKRQLKRQKRITSVKNKTLSFYERREWRELRYSALRKFGFLCMACGRKPPNVQLHVDHIKPRSKYPELELDVNNLQVLCEDCNIGKSNKFEDDFRS